jgi:hypothetical protein
LAYQLRQRIKNADANYFRHCRNEPPVEVWLDSHDDSRKEDSSGDIIAVESDEEIEPESLQVEKTAPSTLEVVQDEPNQSETEETEEIIEDQPEERKDESELNGTEKHEQIPKDDHPYESNDEPPAKKKRSITFAEPLMQKVHFYEQHDMTEIIVKKGKVSKWVTKCVPEYGRFDLNRKCMYCRRRFASLFDLRTHEKQKHFS